MMTKAEIGTLRKIYCNTCKVRTNHELKAVHRRVSFDTDSLTELAEDEEYEEWQYFFWACRGCDTVTLQESYGYFDSDSDRIQHESYFHPRRERRSLPVSIFRQLDRELARIYREVILSFNSDARILCAVGLRALLEGICADKGIEGRDLYTKISGLEAYLPSNIVKSLHRFRFMGNEAAHELQAPSESDLRLAIEVMEDLLNFLYELDYKARSLLEGGVPSPSTVRPSVGVIKRIIERDPAIPRGQKQLYEALYKAGDEGLEITQLAKVMGRTKSQVYGVLGALGRRINNTPGVQDKPGINYVFELGDYSKGGGWGWKMRQELRQALANGNYEWAKDWAK
jgi:hypothetical protein